MRVLDGHTILSGKRLEYPLVFKCVVGGTPTLREAVRSVGVPPTLREAVRSVGVPPTTHLKTQSV